MRQTVLEILGLDAPVVSPVSLSISIGFFTGIY